MLTAEDIRLLSDDEKATRADQVVQQNPNLDPIYHLQIIYPFTETSPLFRKPTDILSSNAVI